MAKKKTSKKRKTRKVKNKINFKLLVLVILLILLTGVAIFINFQKNKTLPETEKTEVKILPKEASKKLLYASTSASFKIPILMYHYVEYVQDKKDKTRQALNINPYIFEQQVITLKNAGYTFITAKDLGDVFDGKKQMPQKPVLLTFDDGHWDLYTDVLPILKKYNVKATAYIITNYLDGSDFLSTDQLLKLSSSGYFEIGSHTLNHVWLKGRGSQQVQNEVQKSKKILEDLIKKPVVSFAYPYGAFDQQAEDIVKNSGYETAVITVPGVIDSVVNRYFLFRLRPGGRIGNELLYYLEQTTFRPWE